MTVWKVLILEVTRKGLFWTSERSKERSKEPTAKFLTVYWTTNSTIHLILTQQTKSTSSKAHWKHFTVQNSIREMKFHDAIKFLWWDFEIRIFRIKISKYFYDNVFIIMLPFYFRFFFSWISVISFTFSFAFKFFFVHNFRRDRALLWMHYCALYLLYLISVIEK